MKLHYVFFVVVALSITCIAQSVVNDCKLSPDLFNRRTAMVKELDSEIAATRMKPGLSISEKNLQGQLRVADQEYHRFMMAVSENAMQHRLGQLNTCCRENVGEPVARLVCGLALYLTKQNTAEGFVQGFPATDDLQHFWALDEIANVEQTPKSVPPLFAPDGPVSLYISELFKLVEKGDKRALQKYLELYLHADGQYAELMQDQMEHLFSERPKIVLDNWAPIRSNQRVIANLQDSLSVNQKQQIKSQFRRYCYVNAMACRDLIAALK
jgi:hypothetical protein